MKVNARFPSACRPEQAVRAPTETRPGKPARRTPAGGASTTGEAPATAPSSGPDEAYRTTVPRPATTLDGALGARR